MIQFTPLLRTLLLAALQDPLTPFKVVPHVGVVPMVDFFKHFLMLGWFTVLYRVLGTPLLALSLSKSLSPATKYDIKRAVEQWKFGSGLDYDDHNDK